MVCTPAFESFSEQLLQITGASVVIPNAFNANDGPAPYTVTGAAFMNLQLPMQALAFTPLGGTQYALSSGITPMVQVTYLDGNGTPRAKIVQAPIQLSGLVTSSVDPNTAIWRAFMETGSIGNPAIAGTQLSFLAAASINVIATPSAPGNLPVLQGLSCAQLPPVQAQCRAMYPLDSYCLLSSVIPGSSTTAIPFAALGPAPYSSPVVTPLGGQPYVLRVVPQAEDVTLIDLAFPVRLSYTDGIGQMQTQDTFLFMTLLMRGVDASSSVRVIANLEAPIILPSSTVNPPALTIQTVVLTGSIAAIRGRIHVLTADAVQCGEVPAAACQPILAPPTAELTA